VKKKKMNIKPFRKSVYKTFKKSFIKNASQKRIGIATAMAAVLLIAAVGSASATDISSCQVINAPGVYDITADLTANPGDICIDIQCGDVILDGQNHLINGTTPQDGSVGIYAYPTATGWSENLTVKNVEIKNFCEGINIAGKDSPGTRTWKDILIEDCVIHDNGLGTGEDNTYMGIHLFRVHESTITKCEVYNQSGKGASCTNGGNGIHLYIGDNNNFSCNNFHNNEKSGLFIKGKPWFTSIKYNYLWENGEAGHGESGGIILRCKRANGTIAYNNASNNIGSGIYIGGPGSTIEYNTVVNNRNSSDDTVRGKGITLQRCHEWVPGDEQNNTLYNNTFCGNEFVDIEVVSTCAGWHEGDYNTCDTCNQYYVNDTHAPAGECCVYKCDSPPTQVYFDFDRDTHYSKDLAECSCGIVGSKGKCACCNPGLFNSSHANNLNASSICWLTAGDDVNDCDPSIPSEEMPYYCDSDNDGYNSATPSGYGTELPPGCQATSGNDCDDTDANVNPGASENCTNGIDDDCDGLIDMADPNCTAPGEEVTVSATVAVAAPEVVCKCEGPDDDPVKPGTQVEPNLWPDTKTVMKCAIVCDPNSIGDIKYVNATTYYPDGTIKETQTMHVANESEKAACCCDTTGLPNETCQVYAGYITMEACDPAGDYTVTVTATDNGGATGELSNTFEYLSIIGLDLDLNAVGFGTIAPGETKVVPGDDVWGTPNLTVHSIGNDPIDIEVSATDMTSDGNVITKDNIDCEIDALGSQWLSAPFTFNINLECCSYENIDLSLHVPEGTAQGAYTGTVTFVAKHA
jgi:hypothetical protein